MNEVLVNYLLPVLHLYFVGVSAGILWRFSMYRIKAHDAMKEFSNGSIYHTHHGGFTDPETGLIAHTGKPRV